MKRYMFSCRRIPSRENAFGAVYDFFLMLDIKRSYLFKYIGRRAVAVLVGKSKSRKNRKGAEPCLLYRR